jgi:hypothetical protein
MRPTPEFLDRFWTRVEKTDGCWLWTGGLVSGYGSLRVGGRLRIKAHRASWWIHNGGDVPSSTTFVCHHCDNPPCVRPDHLFLGTAADNMQDAANKSRMAAGPRHGSKLHPERVPRGDRHGWVVHPESRPKGELNGRAILSVDQVSEIRTLYAAGGRTIRDLGSEFGVSKSTVHFIVSGQTWRE